MNKKLRKILESVAEILEEVNEAIHQFRKSAFALVKNKLFWNLHCKGPFLTFRVSPVFYRRRHFYDVFLWSVPVVYTRISLTVPTNAHFSPLTMKWIGSKTSSAIGDPANVSIPSFIYYCNDLNMFSSPLFSSLDSQSTRTLGKTWII